MNTIATQTVSAVERFGFTLFFATALHAVAIIGITFSSETIRPPQKTIEITLAQHPQKEVPVDADFIAQENQAGSGQSIQKKLPSTQQKALRQDKKTNPQTAQIEVTATETSSSKPIAKELSQPSHKETNGNHSGKLKPKIVTTTSTAEKKSVTAPPKQRQPKQTNASTNHAPSLLARSLDIASLQADIDHVRDIRAKQPRITRLTSASTQKREDALYLNNWRKKIETIGNLHYPEEARRKKMYGSLRLLVAIKPDGAVKAIEVLESSGQPILDDAAIRIVRLGAPFQPFPIEMRKSTDILEIIRTWKFEKKAYID